MWLPENQSLTKLSARAPSPAMMDSEGARPHAARRIIRILLPALLLAASAAAAQPERIGVELNKLEDGEDGACRAFFLFRNGSDVALEGFEISLAILDGGGVIDRLLTIDAAPLPASRTTLRLFDIPETGCTNISEIILHDIPVCEVADAEPRDCYALIDLASRAAAELVR